MVLKILLNAQICTGNRSFLQIAQFIPNKGYSIWKQKGPKSSKLYYRPISLLPTLSKIIESIIHNRLLSHFAENNIISHRQAAYLKGDSTTHQLLYLVHYIRLAWQNGKVVQCPGYSFRCRRGL